MKIQCLALDVGLCLGAELDLTVDPYLGLGLCLGTGLSRCLGIDLGIFLLYVGLHPGTDPGVIKIKKESEGLKLKILNIIKMAKPNSHTNKSVVFIGKGFTADIEVESNRAAILLIIALMDRYEINKEQLP
jgi:hypothetical protein